MTSWPGTAKNSSPLVVAAREHLGHQPRQQLGQRVGEGVRQVRHVGIVGILRRDGLDELGAELVAQHRLDLAVDLVGDRLVVRRLLDHVLAQDRDAHALQRLRRSRERRVVHDEARVRLLGNERLRQRRERIARIVVAGRRILDRVEHLRRVGERARVDAGAVVEPLVADAAAVGHDALRRQQRRDAVARRRALARGAGLLADADRRQVRRRPRRPSRRSIRAARARCRTDCRPGPLQALIACPPATKLRRGSRPARRDCRGRR